jgi:hypothetical protein
MEGVDKMPTKGDRPHEREKSGGVPMWLRILSPVSNLAEMRTGGKVRKTGVRKVHKDERVIPAGKRSKVEKMMKRGKMRMKSR